MARAAEVPDVESAPANTVPSRTRDKAWTPGTALALGAITGLVVGLAVWVVPSPMVGAATALALVVVAPTAPRVDRRIALNLALAIGWLPLAGSVPPVLGPRTAAVLPLALATTLATAVLASGRGRALPTWRRSDAGIVVAGLLAAAVAAPLRFAGDPARALAMLSTGIDNAFHYSLFLERRFTAAGAPALQQLDTSAFANYPKGFHSLLAVTAQVFYGNPGAPPVELQRYAGLEWLLFVIVAVLLTAAFLQALPNRTPAPVVVASLVVLGSLLLGVPGGLNLIQGHLPFLLAATAVTAIVLLNVTPDRVSALSMVATLGLVLTATSWTLLVPSAVAAAAYPLVILWRRQGRALRLATGGVVVVVVLAGAALVLPLVVSGAVRDLVRDGTIPRVGLPALVALVAGPLAVLIVLRRRHGPAVPWLPHLTMLAVGAAQLIALGGYMLAASGSLTYYFWKLGLATLLVSVPVTALLVALASADSAARSTATHPVNARRRRLAATGISMLALLGLGSTLQDFTAPSAAWAAILPVQLWASPASGQVGDVDLVLQLARTSAPDEAERTTLVATRPEDMHAGHASAWFHALSLSTSGRAMSTNDAMYDLGEDRRDPDLAARVARQALALPDARVVVTDVGTYDTLVRVLGPEDARRVTLIAPRAP